MRMINKYTVFVFAVLLCLAGTARAEQIVDRIVAVVNGEIITYQELLQQTTLLTGVESESAAVQAMPQVLDDDRQPCAEASRTSGGEGHGFGSG